MSTRCKIEWSNCGWVALGNLFVRYAIWLWPDLGELNLWLHLDSFQCPGRLESISKCKSGMDKMHMACMSTRTILCAKKNGMNESGMHGLARLHKMLLEERNKGLLVYFYIKVYSWWLALITFQVSLILCRYFLWDYYVSIYSRLAAFALST